MFNSCLRLVALEPLETEKEAPTYLSMDSNHLHTNGVFCPSAMLELIVPDNAWPGPCSSGPTALPEPLAR